MLNRNYESILSVSAKLGRENISIYVIHQRKKLMTGINYFRENFSLL